MHLISFEMFFLTCSYYVHSIEQCAEAINCMHTANASSSCINFIGGISTLSTATDSFCLAGTSAAIVKVSF